MKSALSRRQQTTILAFSLILHLLLLIAMFMTQLQQADLYTKSNIADHEPLITIEHVDHQELLPERDWVAINTAGMPTPLPPSDVPLQKREEPKEQQPTQDAPSITAIKEALALAQEILKVEQHENIPAPEPTPEPPKETEVSLEPTIQKKELKAAPTPQKFTFAQLAQGFTNHLETAAMTVQSNTQGTASVEQLKHLHYCQKIIGCLVTSYKINKGNTPPHKIMAPALIKLALNQDGSIAALTLVQSSGNQSMDRFLLHIFQDASSSFPPVPASFKEKPYPLPIFHVEHLEAFQSVNGWYINNTK